MSFDETELKQLTSAFWSETETDGDKKINYNEFRERILKHPGLPEKLSKRYAFPLIFLKLSFLDIFNA